MKFGSRMDVFLPRRCRRCRRTVGEKVVGGITVLAMLPDRRSSARQDAAQVSLVH